jgi:hypothetical protein
MRASRRYGGMAVCIGCLTSVTAVPPSRLTAQSRLWRPDERLLISDFSIVDAVAASPWFVYAATRHGLLLYDRRARSWQPPVTALEGFPAARVRQALADPVGNAVWLGTAGGWAHYDADIRRWDGGPSSGAVTGLMLDARDPGGGVFLRDISGWKYLPRGALAPQSGTPLPSPNQRILPLDVNTALTLAPMAQALQSLILTDPQLRTYQFTAAARAPDDNTLFLGTNGLGLVRFDPTGGEWEPLRFTLLDVGAVALASGPDGVWAASAGARTGGRSGVTWLPEDLSATRPIEPRTGSGLGVVAIRRMLAANGALWLATDGGLVRFDPESGRTRRFTLGDGLPSEDVRCLAAAPDGVWVGTMRGLAVITERGVERIGQLAQPVLSLLARGDSLWVGSAVGLGVLAPGASDVALPAEVAAEPALRAPIIGLAATGDTIVAVLEDQVGWRDPSARRWTVLRPQVMLGVLSTVASDAGGVWLGGSFGVTFWRLGRGGGSFQSIGVPGDLPAPVRDLTVTAPWVWVATDSGVVRLRGSVLSGM